MCVSIGPLFDSFIKANKTKSELSIFVVFLEKFQN